MSELKDVRSSNSNRLRRGSVFWAFSRMNPIHLETHAVGRGLDRCGRGGSPRCSARPVLSLPATSRVSHILGQPAQHRFDCLADQGYQSPSALPCASSARNRSRFLRANARHARASCERGSDAAMSPPTPLQAGDRPWPCAHAAMHSAAPVRHRRTQTREPGPSPGPTPRRLSVITRRVAVFQPPAPLRVGSTVHFCDPPSLARAPAHLTGNDRLPPIRVLADMDAIERVEVAVLVGPDYRNGRATRGEFAHLEHKNFPRADPAASCAIRRGTPII